MSRPWNTKTYPLPYGTSVDRTKFDLFGATISRILKVKLKIIFKKIFKKKFYVYMGFYLRYIAIIFSKKTNDFF